MPSFIHIADAREKRLIEKNGLKAGKRGVFCTPVAKDFSVTHQWARELRRRGVRSWVCVQFRVSDDQMVSVGIYNGQKILMTAAQAVAAVAEHTAPLGLEVIIKRKIRPQEIEELRGRF